MSEWRRSSELTLPSAGRQERKKGDVDEEQDKKWVSYWTVCTVAHMENAGLIWIYSWN